MLKDDYAKALSYRQYVQIQTQMQTRAQTSHHVARYAVILPPANKQREPDYRFLSGCGGRRVNARSDMGHAKTSRRAISLSPIKFDQFSNLTASLPTTHGRNVQDHYYKRLERVQGRHVRVASVTNQPPRPIMAALQIIDLSTISEAQLASELVRVGSDPGFFYVTGHGIAPAPAFELAREFFKVPRAEKTRYRNGSGDLVRDEPGGKITSPSFGMLTNCS